MTRIAFPFLFFLLLTASIAPAAKDLRTKEERLYAIKLRTAQWEVSSKQLQMENRKSDLDAIQDLYEDKIETLSSLNKAKRAYQQANFDYQQAIFDLKRTRLDFLRDATHLTIRKAVKYRTRDGRRQIDITIENASNLDQAVFLNPGKTPAEIQPLLEVRNIKVSILDSPSSGVVIADPYEMTVPSLKLGESRTLTFRLLEDDDAVVIAMDMLDDQQNDYIVLKRESLQDIPTINSVQFSQEGELNSRVSFDLILERLADDEKTFRLAIVNLPHEIDPAFRDPATNANLTQVKFSEEVTRQQLELELQIPEKLSRKYVDQIIEFYVFITDQEGFLQIGELNRKYGNRTVPLEEVNAIKGDKERFELIPRGKAALEAIIANRYQEVKTGEEVMVRIDLLNTGTLEVEGVYVVLTPPLDWTYTTQPDTIDRILPGDKEPVNITLVQPPDLGVSEYDIRVEAIGYEGNERIESQEKDITIRVEAQADIVRNALIIGGVIALVIGVAVVSIRVSRR
jgi:hypothetical protein